MKFFKKATAAAVCLLMSVSCGTMAFADEAKAPAPSVYVNGQELELDGLEPIIKDDRVFVPLRPIFEALDAEVDYEASSKTVTAVNGDKNVEFAIGGTEVKVTENGALNKFDIDSPAFISNSRTYVPVRFAAQSLGCNVGWDSENRAVIIVDKNTFISQHGDSFEIADKISAFLNSASVQKQKFTGSIDFSVYAGDKDENYTISGNVAIDGKADTSNAEVNCAVALNETQLKAIISAITEGLDAEDAAEAQKTADALKNCTLNFIVDGENLVLYVNSSLFETFMGTSPDTWFKLDVEDLYSQMGIGNVQELITKSQNASIKEQFELCLDMVPVDKLEESLILLETYGSIMEMFSDGAFKQEADGYTSASTTDLGDGAYMTMTITAPTDAEGSITGFGFGLKASQNGKEVISMDIKSTADTAEIKMNMDIDDIFIFDAKGTLNTEPTDEAIKTKPESGNIIDLNEMFGSLIGGSIEPDIQVEPIPLDDITEPAPMA